MTLRPPLGLLLLILVTCASPPARVRPQRAAGLRLPEEPGAGEAERPDGPVRVVFHSPDGEAGPAAEVAVVFDRPMVAMGRADRMPRPPLVLQPSVPGEIRWVGTRTAIFAPQGAIPVATEFTAKVPAGTRALDGTALAEEFSFRFSTPPLRVERVEPYDGANWELPERKIDLYFNQPVSPAQVQRAATLSVSASGGADLTLRPRASRPDANDPRRVRLESPQPFPKGSTVSVQMAADLRGDEGPRPLGADYSSSFSIYGNLGLESEDLCGWRDQPGTPCDPDGALYVRFTQPVSSDDATRLLRVTPALQNARESDGQDDTTTSVFIGRGMRPNTTYTLRIGAVKDTFGNTYQGPRTLRVRAGPYRARAALGIDGRTLEAAAAPRIAAWISNVSQAELRLLRVSPHDVPAKLREIGWGNSEVPALSGAGVKTRTIRPGAGPAERRRLELDVSPVLQNGRGIFVAEFGSTESATYSKFRRQLLSVTDLAATLKYSPRGALAWVTRLSSGAPVAGARITMFWGDRAIDAGATDTDGIATIDAEALFGGESPSDWEAREKLIAVVEHAGDATFVQAHEDAVEPWDLGLTGAWEQAGHDLEAHIFTERGLYRPGERVRIKGLLRRWTDDGLTGVSGEVELTVKDGEGDEIETATLRLSEFGTFAREVRIPANAPLGSLSISAAHGGRQFWASAEVAEYRRAEFEVDASADRAVYARGETAQVSMDGHYLFGAAMSGARVEWTALRSTGSARPDGPGLDEFTFGDDAAWLADETEQDSSVVRSGTGALDLQGRLTERLPLDFALDSGSASVTIEATVHGLGGDAVAGRTSVTVLPGEFLVGISPSGTLVEKGHDLTTSVVTAKLDGERVRNVDVTLELFRREFRSARSVSDVGGSEYQTSHVDAPAGSCRVRSGALPTACDIRIDRPGLHILRAKARDRAGHTIQAATVVWAYGGGGFDWGISDAPRIDLRPDRRQYRVGDVARVLVPSPFASAQALVTVERAGIVSRRRVELVGNAPTIEVPIDERFVPNAFVSVVLVRGRTASGGADDGRPTYKIGTVELRADPQDRHLRVTVSPDRSEHRPGEEMTATIEVKDGRGRPIEAELAVYAVDEGVLTLTGYRTPDPFDTLYAPRGLSVRSVDGRASLMTPLALSEAEGEDKGGDEGGGGGGSSSFRRNFDAVAFYDPAVRTDANGRAEVRFRLPDSLTAFRVMAVAAGRGPEVGAGEARVRTTKPVLLRAMLPRFVRAGDRIEAGVVVHSQGAGSGDARITVEVEGIRLEGEAARTVRVAEGGGAEVRFGFVADTPGRARFRFRARLGDAEDAVEVRRPVSVPSKLETVSSTGETDGAVSEALAPMEGVRPDVGGVEVTLASSALVGLEDPIASLQDYPYECTEQLASKLIPLAAFREIAGAYGLPTGADLEGRIDRTVATLESHQHPDGHFGLWAGSSSFPPLDAFLTGYAAIALHTAKKRGVAVAQSTLDDAARFLSQYLRMEPTLPTWQRLGQADKTFVLYALAEIGKPEPSYHATLYERRDELPLFARVNLAHAIHLAQGDREQVLTLLRDVENHLHVTDSEAHLEENLTDDYDVILHSDVRATAMLLRLILDVNRDHALVPRLVRYMVSTRRPTGAWATTQETTWAVLAMSDYSRALEREEPDFEARARVGRTKLATARFQGRSLRTERASLAMSKVPEGGAPVVLRAIGDGRLFYNVRLRYARAKLPDTPLDRGIFVERRYERIDPATIDRPRAAGTPTLEAAAGDLVRVTLRIVVPEERRFVVVDDPLPAGLEVVNFNLDTATQRWRSAGNGYGDDDDQGTRGEADWGDVAWWENPFYHREDRDDRVVLSADVLQAGLYRYEYVVRAVTPGRYVVPPTHAEEMYSKENFGRTEAVTFTVRAP